MLLNPYLQKRALMLQRRRQMMNKAMSIVPVHSYNPVSINLQSYSDEVKLVPLDKKEYVLIDSDSSDSDSSDSDSSDSDSSDIDSSDIEIIDNETPDNENVKIVSIDPETMKVSNNTDEEETEESKLEGDSNDNDEDNDEETEESKLEGDNNDNDEETKEDGTGSTEIINGIKGGGDLIKNVIVSFF